MSSNDIEIEQLAKYQKVLYAPLNDVTQYYYGAILHLKYQKEVKSEILIIRCLIEDLVQLPRWFFTDGQGNDMVSNHYNDLSALNNIDWPCIQRSNFSKGDGDFDRPRRYQTEFLVHENLPEHIESLSVYNAEAADM